MCSVSTSNETLAPERTKLPYIRGVLFDIKAFCIFIAESAVCLEAGIVIYVIGSTIPSCQNAG
jgi:hypothetical protein